MTIARHAAGTPPRAGARLGLVLAACVLAAPACVTINVYFPAAAAEKAADRIIDEVWGDDAAARGRDKSSRARDWRHALSTGLGALVEWLVPAAHAQQADLNIATPAIEKLEAAMKQRHAALAPYYASGAVGLTADGFVAVRDANAIPLQARTRVNQLVAEENRDRAALYREIAIANGHPEWQDQIRETFARQWVERAQPGWYYQSGGAWTRKQ
ncbi:MAG: YdbL family protein [Gammaproteobacteria bacterium]|nr:YdbL family protein [Gammaproteobacteria bacterium]